MRVHAAVGEESVGDCRSTSAEAHVCPLGVSSDELLGDPIAENLSTELGEVTQADPAAERLIVRVGGGEPAQLRAGHVLILTTTGDCARFVPRRAR